MSVENWDGYAQQKIAPDYFVESCTDILMAEIEVHHQLEAEVAERNTNE